MPQVKGLAFRSVIQAHSSIRGKSSLDDVFDRLGKELAGSLQYVVASSWYPIEHYAKLWSAIQSVTGNDPNYPRTIGRRCAEQDLKVVHKLVLSVLNVSTVISTSARLFGGYYDTGKCASNRIDERKIRVTFEGCTGFSAPMWTELRGVLETFAELAVSKATASTLLSGGDNGSPACVIDVTW